MDNKIFKTTGLLRLKTKIKIFLAVFSLVTVSVSLYTSAVNENYSNPFFMNNDDICSEYPSAGSESQIGGPMQNNPPEIPVKPSGPTFVEMDVEYTYMTTTFDRDGDQIRYQFDWGDGTCSSWTDFASSNISVSMSHIWNVISDHHVRVLAQDINGINSSWSTVTNVVVSQVDSEGMPPFIVVSDNNFSDYIWNSNGNHWDATGSNIQQAIWDLNSTDGGMIWVGSDVDLSSPIRLRDNVILDFQKNQVTLIDDI